MSVSIKYKGAEIASASTEVTKTIKTSGKYCEADILVENTPDSGDAPVINPLSVTENGTYTAPSGVDGYSPVTVNVPQGITPTGKITITENGTDIDVAQYALADVNVSGGTTITDGIVVKARNASGKITEIDFYGTKIENSQFRSGQSTRESWLPFANLEKVNYKNTITAIGEYAFLGCSLTEIPLPSTVTSIGAQAFRYQGSAAVIEPVYMPPTQFSINDFIFANSKITKFYDYYSHNYATGTPHSHQGCTLLQDVQLGSVGYPCLGIENLTFGGCSQTGLTITIFCAGANADSLLSATRNGATNATVIIKASEDTTYGGTSYAAGETMITSNP